MAIGHLPTGTKGVRLRSLLTARIADLVRVFSRTGTTASSGDSPVCRTTQAGVLNAVFVAVRTLRLRPVKRSDIPGRAWLQRCFRALSATLTCTTGSPRSAILSSSDDGVLSGVLVPIRAVRLTALERAGCAAALRIHVGVVVGQRAEKQVRGVHAGWVVAVMARRKAVRNRSVVQFPRHAVRELRATVLPELAVSLRVLGRRPQPAPIGLLHLRPEAVWDRNIAKVGHCFAVGGI